MTLLLDSLYVPKLMPRLKNFKRKNTHVWNFRCPFCGDSQKNKTKARGYIFKRKNNLQFYCHNCNTSMNFKKFLNKLDPQLYKTYQLEELEGTKKKFNADKFKTNTKKSVDDNIETASLEINLDSIEDLDHNHPAKQFCINRKIPQNFFTDLYYASDFAEFVNEIIPKTKKTLVKNDRRIVIPFRNENNILQGFQGRTLLNSSAKYITILINDEASKIYGINRLDFTRPIYVVEGPFDSLFLNNAIAATDSQLYNVPFRLNRQNLVDLDFVFIYDNEPRNKEILKNMRKTIAMGHKIFIWPTEFEGIKDINEAILNGYNQSVIHHIIQNRTFHDLNAEMEFSQWTV